MDRSALPRPDGFVRPFDGRPAVQIRGPSSVCHTSARARHRGLPVLVLTGDTAWPRGGGQVFASSARIIAYLSFRMADSETRYSSPETEVLAVVKCLRDTAWITSTSEFPIKVYTDYKAIVTSMAQVTKTHSEVDRADAAVGNRPRSFEMGALV